MKKLIFLKQKYAEGKNKTEIAAAQQSIFKQSVETFKEQMKGLTQAFKIIKEVPTEAVLIEYSEVIDDQMWDALRAADIVSIIDSIIPSHIS